MESDAELIGRSLTGDGEAFMEVVCRHEAAVGAYLARRAGTLLARWPALCGQGVSETWTINASTGIPVSYEERDPAPGAVVTYQVSRVTVSNIAAGKF